LLLSRIDLSGGFFICTYSHLHICPLALGFLKV
jgi:hypothetical protein